MSLFRKKSLSAMLANAEDSTNGLQRTLGAGNLIALGIGAIIGAGLFVRTAAAAGQSAGPAVTISFVIAAIGCAFAGLCYAEFAAMIPIAGSAYAYSYVTLGELVAGSGPPAFTAIIISLPILVNCLAILSQRANMVALRTSKIRPIVFDFGWQI